MKLLLTSAGIKNPSINGALVGLLGKPIAESSALCIPTAAYGHPKAGPGAAWRFISGQEPRCLMVGLGWKSMGVLELTTLPSIDEEQWVPLVQETDVLLVDGGDTSYLCHWMQQSGLADLLPSLRETVYVGLSAGSMVMTPASERTSSTGSRLLAATKRLEWSISRSFRTWTTRNCRRIPWPTRKSGRPVSVVNAVRGTSCGGGAWCSRATGGCVKVVMEGRDRSNVVAAETPQRPNVLPAAWHDRKRTVSEQGSGDEHTAPLARMVQGFGAISVERVWIIVRECRQQDHQTGQDGSDEGRAAIKAESTGCQQGDEVNHQRQEHAVGHRLTAISQQAERADGAFEPAEEQLDFPAPEIGLHHLSSREIEAIGEQLIPLDGVPTLSGLAAGQHVGGHQTQVQEARGGPIIRTPQADALVGHDGHASARCGQQGRLDGIVFQDLVPCLLPIPGHDVNTGIQELAEPIMAVVAQIKDQGLVSERCQSLRLGHQSSIEGLTVVAPDVLGEVDPLGRACGGSIEHLDLCTPVEFQPGGMPQRESEEGSIQHSQITRQVRTRLLLVGARQQGRDDPRQQCRGPTRRGVRELTVAHHWVRIGRPAQQFGTTRQQTIALAQTPAHQAMEEQHPHVQWRPEVLSIPISLAGPGTHGVEISVGFQRSLGAGVFGGDGFRLTHLAGQGTAWVELSGEVITYDLAAGETLRVHPGHVGMFDTSVSFDITRIKGIKNMLFGGDDIFLAALTGPGKVWLQTLTVVNLAHAIIPYLPNDD
jgi:hypothetical protein